MFLRDPLLPLTQPASPSSSQSYTSSSRSSPSSSPSSATTRSSPPSHPLLSIFVGVCFAPAVNFANAPFCAPAVSRNGGTAAHGSMWVIDHGGDLLVRMNSCAGVPLGASYRPLPVRIPFSQSPSFHRRRLQHRLLTDPRLPTSSTPTAPTTPPQTPSSARCWRAAVVLRAWASAPRRVRWAGWRVCRCRCRCRRCS